LAGASKLAKKGAVTVMQSGDLKKVNSLDNPTDLAPQTQSFVPKGKSIKADLAPYSFTIYRIGL
jgi:hypothetical protein